MSKKQLTKSQIAKKFQSIFLHHPEGAEVLEHLRYISNYDYVFSVKPDERTQMYQLGKASIYAYIKELLEYSD